MKGVVDWSQLACARISELQENCMSASPNLRGRSLLYLVSIFVVILALSQTATAAGTTITVNSTFDVADSSDGLCTLREAITAANSDTASGATAGECAAGSASESDTISLAGLTGTITLASALPAITTEMSIAGPGQSQLTISGNNSVRVFNLTLSSGLVSFSGLTIASGRANMDVGGGIYNQNGADVNVTECTISNNFAVLGGGIANSSIGTFTVTNSTIRNNVAGTAGGCYNGLGTLNIINSTLNNNLAGPGGGSGNGGAINTGSNTLNVINSTLTNNLAFNGGGAIFNLSSDAKINITQSTISHNSATNGGGISSTNGALVKILNTIITENGAPNGPDLFGAFVSLGHNFVNSSAGSTGFTPGTNNPNGDLVGSLFAGVFAVLGPLQNNGGPTQTRALLPGSPAIDAGDNCVVQAGGCLTTPLTTDQRGVSRQVNSTVDMGAFESREFTFSVTSGTPQSAAVNTLFGSPLLVTVNSASGDPVAGGLVAFIAPASGPSVIFNTGQSGTVEFINSNGQASTRPSANGLAGGPYNVAATIDQLASSVSFSLTNTQAASTTTVTSSSNPSDLNQSVTFTATVTSTGTPTGIVQFKIDGTNLGSTVNLVGGVATISTAALTVGAHAVTADYSGDSNFTPSTGTLSGGQIVRPPPTLSINDITFTEGDVGVKFVFFTVTSTAASNSPISVDFMSANGSATAPSDYQSTTGTVTFSPGQVTRTIFVTINGDTGFEPDETFTMTISNPVNGSITRAQGTATIQNDDAPVLLTEGNTSRAIGLDSVTQTRDPFSLTTVHNFSADQHRRVSLFVWRLGLLPGDTIANVTVVAEDDQGRVYPLTVEFITPLTGPDDVSQVIVRLPDNVIGAPRNLGVTVRVRGPISNKAFISIL